MSRGNWVIFINIGDAHLEMGHIIKKVMHFLLIYGGVGVSRSAPVWGQ